MVLRLHAALGACFAMVLGVGDAVACGGQPVAPAALALTSADRQGSERAWRVGPFFRWTRNEHGFGQNGVLEHQTIGALTSWRAVSDLVLHVGLGATSTGRLHEGDRSHRLDPGPCGLVAASYTIYPDEGWKPFVVLAGMAGVVAATSDGPSLRIPGTRDRNPLTTLDLRVSLTVGKVFGDVIGPYASFRTLGGPQYWTLDGRDRNSGPAESYQLAAGLIVHGGPVDARVEVAPLGEQALNVAAGWIF